MMVICVALASQLGNRESTEQTVGVTKRNGFVPLITSSLELDTIRRNTLEELCLKYVNINLNGNCPVCVCHESEFESENAELGCLEQCTEGLFSGESGVGFKGKKPVMGSLGFDQMEKDKEDLQNFGKQAGKNEFAKSEKLKIVGDFNEEEMMNIMDDELPHAEEIMYICEKMDPTQLGPDMFNFEVKSGQVETEKRDPVFMAEKLKTM